MVSRSREYRMDGNSRLRGTMMGNRRGGREIGILHSLDPRPSLHALLSHHFDQLLGAVIKHTMRQPSSVFASLPQMKGTVTATLKRAYPSPHNHLIPIAHLLQ